MRAQAFNEWLHNHPQDVDTLWVIQNCLGTLFGYEHPMAEAAGAAWKDSKNSPKPECEHYYGVKLPVCVKCNKVQSDPKEPEKRDTRPTPRYLWDALSHQVDCIQAEMEKKESDYYTKQEIDSQNQLLFDIIKKLKGGKEAISETVEFRKAFPFLF